MRLPRRATHLSNTNQRRLGVGLAALGAVGIVGLLGPGAPLVAGEAPQVDVARVVSADSTAMLTTMTTAARTAVDDAAAVTGTAADGALAVRTTTRLEHRVSVIPAPEQRRDNDVLALGETRIDQVGVDGLRQEVVEVTVRNGDVADEHVVDVTVTAPTPTLISVGTSTSDAATKDWAALAQCESGGDPTIVSASGRYHGLYQFDVSTWRSVGGVGLPSEATPDEQLRRAMALYEQRGAQPWPTCGRHL